MYFFLSLNQYICCGYSKEPPQLDGSFEHPKHVLKLMKYIKKNPFLCSGLQKFFDFSTKSIKYTWQKYQRRALLNYCGLYIFKICAL